MSKYPTTYSRVSAKAIVRDGAGRVLLCKENSPNWNLPGGGIEHTEQPLQGLQRELAEELGFSFEADQATLVGARTFFVEEKDIYMLWLVYELHLTPTITLGPEVTEAAFIDTTQFKDSQKRGEQLIYWATQTDRW